MNNSDLISYMILPYLSLFQIYQKVYLNKEVLDKITIFFSNLSYKQLRKYILVENIEYISPLFIDCLYKQRKDIFDKIERCLYVDYLCYVNPSEIYSILKTNIIDRQTLCTIPFVMKYLSYLKDYIKKQRLHIAPYSKFTYKQCNTLLISGIDIVNLDKYKRLFDIEFILDNIDIKSCNVQDLVKLIEDLYDYDKDRKINKTKHIQKFIKLLSNTDNYYVIYNPSLLSDISCLVDYNTLSKIRLGFSSRYTNPDIGQVHKQLLSRHIDMLILIDELD